MDKIAAKALRNLTLEGWNDLLMLFSFAETDILELTISFDEETMALSATGASVVLLPKKPNGVLLTPKVHELGVPAKPEKYLQLAAEKAHRTNKTGLFTSSESRDVDTGKYGGAHAISNHTGAIGLSGFAEPDDHVILGLGMAHAGLISKLSKPGVSDFHYWEYMERITFEVWPDYPIARYHDFEGIFSRAKTKLKKYKADKKYIAEHTAS